MLIIKSGRRSALTLFAWAPYLLGITACTAHARAQVVNPKPDTIWWVQVFAGSPPRAQQVAQSLRYVFPHPYRDSILQVQPTLWKVWLGPCTTRPCTRELLKLARFYYPDAFLIPVPTHTSSKKKKTPKKERRTTTQAAHTPTWYIQIGAYRLEFTADSAYAHCQRTITLAPCRILFHRGFYRVLIGPFPQENTARQQLPTIRRHYPDAFLIQIPAHRQPAANPRAPGQAPFPPPPSLPRPTHTPTTPTTCIVFWESRLRDWNHWLKQRDSLTQTLAVYRIQLTGPLPRTQALRIRQAVIQSGTHYPVYVVREAAGYVVQIGNFPTFSEALFRREEWLPLYNEATVVQTRIPYSVFLRDGFLY